MPFSQSNSSDFGYNVSYCNEQAHLPRTVMKITNKLRMLAILPITLAVVVVGTVFLSARRIDKVQRQERAAVNIVKDAFVLDMRAHEYLYMSDHGPERPRQQWLSKHKLLKQQMADMVALSDGDQSILDRMQARHKKIDSRFSEIIEKREELERASGEHAQFLEMQKLNLTRKLLQESQSFRDAVTELADSSHQSAQQTLRNANLLVFILVTATVPLLLVIYGLTTRSITKPIARLQEGAEVIGRGDLGHRVGTVAQDEIGELSRDFDQMAIQLQSMIDELRQSEAEVRALNESLERRVEERTAEVAARNQDLETMLYVASHDLREPLRAIQSFSRMVVDQYSEELPEEAQDFLRRVMRGADRLDGLIDDVLVLSRAQRMQDPTTTVECQAIVSDVLTTLENKITETGAKVQVADDLPTLLADNRWATQTVYNLVANALKFTKDGEVPELEIAAYDPDDADSQEVGIVVRDRGIGIAPEHAERIFTLFQRAVGRDIDGHGAGLAIVRQIAERHGGRTWAEPRDGGGSEFFVTFGNAPVV